MIANCRKNIMGTLSFDGKFPGMRKAQDFIVYPMHDSSESITVQSDTRFGQIDLATGKAVMSAPHSNGAYAVSLQMDCMRGKAKRFEIAVEDRETLRQWVKSTGGVLVGGSVCRTDNTGAMAL